MVYVLHRLILNHSPIPQTCERHPLDLTNTRWCLALNIIYQHSRHQTPSPNTKVEENVCQMENTFGPEIALIESLIYMCPSDKSKLLPISFNLTHGKRNDGTPAKSKSKEFSSWAGRCPGSCPRRPGEQLASIQALGNENTVYIPGRSQSRRCPSCRRRCKCHRH